MGEWARQYPKAVIAAKSMGHTIRSHSNFHEDLTTLSASQLRSDLAASKKILEDIVGQKIVHFRAPSFSLSPEQMSIVREAGFLVDSSTSNASRIFGGNNKLNVSLDDFVSIAQSGFKFLGKEITILGDGYLRIIPPWLLRLLANHDLGNMIYLHPVDFYKGVPNGPNTAYGYLTVDRSLSDNVKNVLDFHEKPELERAMELIASGNCFWNSGLFLFQAKQLIKAMKENYPEQFEIVSQAIEALEKDLTFSRLGAIHWNALTDISVDNAVMEQADNLVMLPLLTKWADLGSWSSVQKEYVADVNGNSSVGDVFTMNCERSFLRSESDQIKLVGLGLKDIIAVATDDAVLIINKYHDQDLKKLVTQLEDADIPQATTFRKVYRPWGYFESLTKADGFQVKRIMVNPGGKLSLQSHFHRSEHWVISTGTAVIEIDGELMTKTVGESVFIPLGSKHSLEDKGKIPLTVIEVQIGGYQEEDDIVRYSDIYNRISEN